MDPILELSKYSPSLSKSSSVHCKNVESKNLERYKIWNHSWRNTMWEKVALKIQHTISLDDLDTQIIHHFQQTIPRPTTLEFCSYDIDKEEVLILCQHPRPFDSFSYQVEGSETRQSRCIISLFLSHCSYEMMGTWKDFPSFAGICAVWLRRNSPMLEQHLSPYFIHSNEHGIFTDTDKELLQMWVKDILKPDPNSKTNFEECLSYLILYEAFGGDSSTILRENILISDHTKTPLYHGIIESCSQTEHNPKIDDTWIRNVYLSKDSEWRYGDQKEFIQESWVEKTIANLKQIEDNIAPFP